MNNTCAHQKVKALVSVVLVSDPEMRCKMDVQVQVRTTGIWHIIQKKGKKIEG